MGYFRTWARKVPLLGQPTRPDGQLSSGFVVRNILPFFGSTPAESTVKRCALAYAPKIRIDTYSFTAYLTSRSSPELLVRTEAVCASTCLWQMTRLSCVKRSGRSYPTEKIFRSSVKLRHFMKRLRRLRNRILT